jgi:hypothetical protein
VSKRPSGSELLAWILLGAGVGVVAGFLFGELAGGRRPRRARSVTPAAAGPVAATRAAQRALDGDEILRGLGLTPVGVGVGAVELHGWVATRSLRARAARTVQAAPGIDTLINCLLVHGEDDGSLGLDEPTGQTA